MTDLSPLIRLHRHELDEKRRVLSDLYGEMAELERARRDLEREYTTEKDALVHLQDVHFTFAKYAETVQRRREELDQQEQAMEKQIEKAKESLMETFSELKKYEMTQAERERLAEEERRIRDGRAMDAIGLEGFRRKSEE